MTTSKADRPPRWVALVVMLALAVGLIGVPSRVRVPLRGGLATVLRPGQRSTLAGIDTSRAAARWVQAAGRGAESIAQLNSAIAGLRDENRQLKLELAMIGYGETETVGQEEKSAEGAPLLVPNLVRARVLGEDAVGVLERRMLVSIGSSAGVEPDALVLDVPATIVDQGRDEGVAKNDLVLAARAVVGRVSNTGSSASGVQLVTDSQFRARVQLVSLAGTVRRTGPEGVLAGTGEPVCRIEHVSVSHPVALGDLVYSVGGQGVLPHPLLYGKVIRAESGTRFWNIWVRPAADLNQLRNVMVLRTDLNPERMAKEKADRLIR